MDASTAREIADGILGNPGLIRIDPQTRVDLTYEITRELIAAYSKGFTDGNEAQAKKWTDAIKDSRN